MRRVPSVVADFLELKRIAVAGVSREPGQPANAIYRKLVSAGYDVVPLNPHAQQVEGARCYSSVGDVPGGVRGVLIATPPAAAADIVRQCASAGVTHVWFHRSFGQGSVADDAVRECATRHLRCIVGGCPLMYLEPVDVGHRCLRWMLGFSSRLPR